MITFDIKQNVDLIDLAYAYTLGKLIDVYRTRRIISNWYDVVLFMLGLKSSMTVRFRSGHSMRFDGKRSYFRFWGTNEGRLEISRVYYQGSGIRTDDEGIRFNRFGRHLFFRNLDKIDNGGIVRSVVEMFFSQQYAVLDVRGRAVLDIGANIGDSAVYFACKGAKMVYAYEPYPYSYRMAKMNVHENRFEKKIKLANEGCAGRDGIVRIETHSKGSTGSRVLAYSQQGKRVMMRSLGSIASMCRIKDGILKIDCEGDEYDILLNADVKTLRSFRQMMIEYHYGYRNIAQVLKNAGFELEISRPKFDYTPRITSDKDPLYLIGTIFAKRIANGAR